MLKFTIYTSLLVAVILHAAIATDDNGLASNNPIADKPLLSDSMYASLYSAIEMDSADEVEQFISFGADVNHLFKGAITPIMLASSMGSIDVVHALIELGANSSLTSTDKLTALDYAKQSGHQLIVTALENNTYSTKADPEIIIIRKIQFLLGRLGYDAGEIDGEYGERTKSSLESFSLDSKQSYPVEISNQQVESLKNVFFKQDLFEVATSLDKNTKNTLNKDTEEEFDIIKAVLLESTSEISSSHTARSDSTIAPAENQNTSAIH